MSINKEERFSALTVAVLSVNGLYYFPAVPLAVREAETEGYCEAEIQKCIFRFFS